MTKTPRPATSAVVRGRGQGDRAGDDRLRGPRPRSPGRAGPAACPAAPGRGSRAPGAPSCPTAPRRSWPRRASGRAAARSSRRGRSRAAPRTPGPASPRRPPRRRAAGTTSGGAIPLPTPLTGLYTRRKAIGSSRAGQLRRRPLRRRQPVGHRPGRRGGRAELAGARPWCAPRRRRAPRTAVPSSVTAAISSGSKPVAVVRRHRRIVTGRSDVVRVGLVGRQRLRRAGAGQPDGDGRALARGGVQLRPCRRAPRPARRRSTGPARCRRRPGCATVSAR